MKKLLLHLLILLLISIVITSCKSQDDKNREQVAGVWEFKQPDTLKTFTLNKDNTFEAKIVVTEEDSELIINKGDISGKWHLEGNKFSLKIGKISTGLEKDIDWKLNQEIPYTFNSVSLKKLRLKQKDKKLEWKRTIDPKTNEPMNSKDIFIEMKPLAVNLYKDRIRGKERFLCLHYKLQFEDVDDMNYIITTKEEEFAKTYHELHPRIRDAIIMFLSSQTFKEVKTFARSNKMNKKLHKILNHYLDNKLKSLEIERIVVASSKEGVNDFAGFEEDEKEEKN